MPKFDYAYFQAQLINTQIIQPSVAATTSTSVSTDAPIYEIKLYEHIVAPASNGSKNPDANPTEIGDWYIDVGCNKLYHWHCGAWRRACHKRVIVDASGFAGDETTVITSVQSYVGYAYHTNYCGHMFKIRWGIVADSTGDDNDGDDPDDLPHLYRAHCDTPLTPADPGRYFNSSSLDQHHCYRRGVKAYELYQINSDVTDGTFTTLENYNGRVQFSSACEGYLYCDEYKWYRFNFITQELRCLRHEISEIWDSINSCIVIGETTPALAAVVQAKLAQAKTASRASGASDASDNVAPNANSADPEFDGQDDTPDNTTPQGVAPNTSVPVDKQDSLPHFDASGVQVDGSGNPVQLDASGHPF